MTLNAAHLHLLLNHIPTVGLVFAVALLAVALLRRSEALEQASYEAMFLIAVLTLPAYISGVAAAAAIAERPGVSSAAIDAHQDAAFLAFSVMQAVGFVAWLVLWLRRRARPAAWGASVLLGLSVLTLACMTNAALVGGEVRHPEIRVDETAEPAAGMVPVSAITASINDTPWAWPAAETLHFIGMSLLFGVLALANVRVLGFMKGIPFAAIHRLLPWSALGFAINIATGMLFIIGSAAQYVDSGPFHWKMALLVPAGANLLYLTVVDSAWALEGERVASAVDKAIALSAIAFLVGVMYLGRMLPFIGTSF